LTQFPFFKRVGQVSVRLASHRASDLTNLLLRVEALMRPGPPGIIGFGYATVLRISAYAIVSQVT